MLAALEDAQAGVHVQLHGYDAASGTLTFSAVLPQVVDIPAYVRRLEGNALFAQVAYSGYETGADGYTLQLDCVLAAPENGGEGGRAMRLETAVTERDKKLLYGVGLAAAVLLYGVFALSPALQATPRRARERRQAADRRGQMQAAAGEAAARESERKAAAAAVREAARDAYPLLSSEELGHPCDRPGAGQRPAAASP